MTEVATKEFHAVLDDFSNARGPTKIALLPAAMSARYDAFEATRATRLERSLCR
jgi:hypothetical protein